jgi:hypothetical protein
MSNILLGRGYQVFNDVKHDVKWTCPCCFTKVIDKHKMFCWVNEIRGVRVCYQCMEVLCFLDGVEW